MRIHACPAGMAMMIAVGILALGVAQGRGADADKAVDDYNFAAWLYNTGKYGLAVESYVEFLKNHPNHEKKADVLFGLAQSQFHLNKFAEAAKQYEILRAQHADFPQMPEVLFQLGQSLVALEKFEEANPLFGAVGKKHRDHYLADWATARRAACLISLDKPDAAEELLIPFVDRYAPTGRKAAGVPATREMFKVLKEAGIKAEDAFLNLVERSAFYLALAQFNQARFANAQKTFRRFLDQYPDSALADEARFRLAQSLYRESDFARAADAYAPVAGGNGEFAPVAAFERGLSLYKAGKLKDASSAFSSMAKQFPSHPRVAKAILYSGTFLYESQDYAGAIDKLRPLAEKGADLADEAAYWISMSLLKQDKAPEARSAFEEALAKHPGSSLAGDMRLGLADAQLAQEDYEAAAASFESYTKANRDTDQSPRALYSACVALHRADKYERSDKLCDTFLKQFGNNDLVPQALFLSGEDRFLAKQYDAAAARYGEFLKQKDVAEDRVARAHFRLAWTHRYAGRHKEALAELAEIKRNKAGDIAAECDYLRGICLFDTEAYAAAVKSLEAYLGAPDHARFGDDALFKTGMAWIRRNERRKAVRMFARFLKDFPDSELLAHAQYQLAECHYEMKQYSPAIENYRLVAGRETADELSPYAMFGLGLSYHDQKKWKQAAEAFGRLTDRFPNSDLTTQSFYRRGRALMSMSQWADAAGAFGSLLKAAGRSELARSAQVSVATCLQKQKEWSKAAAAFRTAIDKYSADDGQARLYYELAWSWREAGNQGESLQAFRDLADKFENDPLAADAFFHLGEALYKPGDDKAASETDEARATRLRKAAALYEKVLKVTQDKRLADKALYRIGWCSWQREEYEDAAGAFDRLIEDCPKSDLLPDAHFQSGLAHAKAGDRETAVKRLERLTSDSAFAGFQYLPDALLAMGDHRLSLGEPETALKSLDAFIAKNTDHPGLARAQLLKGKALYTLKRYDEAMASLKESTNLTRSDVAAEAQFYIGQAHQIQSDFKHALMAYLRVQALYAGAREWVAAATFECAKCQEALGQSEEAVASLKDVATNYKDTQWAKLAEARLK